MDERRGPDRRGPVRTCQGLSVAQTVSGYPTCRTPDVACLDRSFSATQGRVRSPPGRAATPFPNPEGCFCLSCHASAQGRAAFGNCPPVKCAGTGLRRPGRGA